MVDPLLAQMGRDLQPGDRQEYDGDVGANLALAGDPACTSAPDEGLAMTLEQAAYTPGRIGA